MNIIRNCSLCDCYKKVKRHVDKLSGIRLDHPTGGGGTWKVLSDGEGAAHKSNWKAIKYLHQHELSIPL